MFTPNQTQAVSELIRVCKPGGKIGMANWTPDGFIGRLFKTIGQYVSPPPGINSPAAWGTRGFLEENFASRTARLQSESRNFMFRYQSPRHWLDLFATYYGPLLKAFEALDKSTAEKLSGDVLRLIQRFNTAEDGTMVVPSEYLEVIVVK